MNNTQWHRRGPILLSLSYLLVYYLYRIISVHIPVSFAESTTTPGAAGEIAFVAVSSVMLFAFARRYEASTRRTDAAEMAVAESGPSLIRAAGADRSCFYFNGAWLSFTGRDVEEELGGGWVVGIHPEERARVAEALAGAFDSCQRFKLEYRLLTRDGEYRWIQDDGCPRFSADGTFIGYISFCTDVTERKQLEMELAQNIDFMGAVLDSLTDGVVVVDRLGRISLANRASRSLCGFPDQVVSHERWHEFFDLYEQDGTTKLPLGKMPIFVTLDGGEITDQELIIVGKEAPPRSILASGRQILASTGEKIGAVMTLHDITTVKILEEHVRQSQKLDSIGTLAGGVAHDFNNVLSVIMAAGTLLEMKTADNPEQVELISQINASAERAAKLTNSLLAFSRKQTMRKQPEDICNVIMIMQHFLRRIIGEDIMLMTYLPETPLVGMIDRGQMEQVLMNLAANARDAMPNGGVLKISVSGIETDGTLLELEGKQAGKYALITVTDTGEGMDKETRQRVFEPFFTTKALGNGTGLGLSTAYGIVRQHGGVIHLFSNPGEGTTISIYLPLQDRKVEAPVAQSIPVRRGSETILLVEDDREVLAINKELLESAGYTVLGAQSGSEALELFKNGVERIALVIIDVIMPGMNGKDVYDRLKTYKSNVKVLFASGYTSDILKKKGVIYESANFMFKPFNPPVFLGRVRRLIDA